MRYAIALLLIGCVPVKPDPLPPVPDAGCVEACSTQRELGCEGGLDTEEGEPCESVCAATEDLVPGSYHAPCVTAARDCGEVEACFGG